MNAPSIFALALTQMEGVGSVTASRLLKHFNCYDDLLRYPREQVLARIKGAPRAGNVVAALFDQKTFRSLLANSKASIDALAERHISILSMNDDGWPISLNSLPRTHRPILFYTFGRTTVLESPKLSMLLPFSAEDFSSDVLSALDLHSTDVSLCTDLTIAHLPTAVDFRIILVAGCGLSRIPPGARIGVKQVIANGGLLLSPFPMTHGPFPHDQKVVSWILAALANAIVFRAPGALELEISEWAHAAGKPTFAFAQPDHPPPTHAHLLATSADFEWVTAALNSH